jgi:hypothetical protein
VKSSLGKGDKIDPESACGNIGEIKMGKELEIG